ncbi:MAG: aminoacyl-tRNA hydrolase [Ureaplasma sp.]|nr:aminoacyl-tRNA hydrolase [Ureaplasma sp.]MDE7222134.1 aminoacyl-tRNA hydrolase [Ureaplasma sp.]
MENYLIVGLGNPGSTYNNTRHQIGMMMLDFFYISNKKKLDISDFQFESKFNAEIAKFTINDKNIILAKPTTYMNLSGDFVQKFIQFYKIPLKNVLIIYDDISLEIGKYKLKTNSSAGGHNGIKDIIQKLGTESIMRLKIGILNEKIKSKMNLKDYVLSKFNKDELEIYNKLFIHINKIILDFANLDFLILCSLYNGNNNVNF